MPGLLAAAIEKKAREINCLALVFIIFPLLIQPKKDTWLLKYDKNLYHNKGVLNNTLRVQV
ncbi:MAG: hypothetical protein EBS81_02625 [Gammaproteobacteria bacterium]|nr:hypothetical protein [Gammaproteobacteria bacterium]